MCSEEGNTKYLTFPSIVSNNSTRQAEQVLLYFGNEKTGLKHSNSSALGQKLIKEY